VDAAGDVFVTGYTTGTLDIEGCYASVAGVATEAAGNVFVIGSTGDTDDDSYEVFVARHDPDGTPRWEERLEGSASLHGITLDDAGDVVIVMNRVGTVVVAKHER
jgi:hypothetical protein